MLKSLKTFTSLCLAGCIAALGFTSVFQSTANAVEASTVPVGFVTWNISGGTGTSRVITPLAVPLVETPSTLSGKSAGRLTEVGANSLSDFSANWAADELSNSTDPKLIRIKTGAAKGRTFLISTSDQNTSDTLTIDVSDAQGIDLTSLGIAVGQNGDEYEILNCDYLASLFGDPSSTGIVGGTSPTNADIVRIHLNGVWVQFYFNTNLNRWTRRTLGNPDATYQAVRPDAGVLFDRLVAQDLKLVLLGRVPDVDRTVKINAAGLTVVGNTWPVDIQLNESGIENIPGWVSSPDVNQADLARLYKNGVWQQHWFDGTTWRRRTLGSPASGTEVIPSGSIVLVEKRTATALPEALTQTLPYTLE